MPGQGKRLVLGQAMGRQRTRLFLSPGPVVPDVLCITSKLVHRTVKTTCTSGKDPQKNNPH